MALKLMVLITMLAIPAPSLNSPEPVHTSTDAAGMYSLILKRGFFWEMSARDILLIEQMKGSIHDSYSSSSGRIVFRGTHADFPAAIVYAMQEGHCQSLVVSFLNGKDPDENVAKASRTRLTLLENYGSPVESNTSADYSWAVWTDGETWLMHGSRTAPNQHIIYYSRDNLVPLAQKMYGGLDEHLRRQAWLLPQNIAFSRGE